MESQKLSQTQMTSFWVTVLSFINIKKAWFFWNFFTAFYVLDTEPEPEPESEVESEPYLVKIRNRNRNK